MSSERLPAQPAKRKTIQEIYLVRTLAILGVLMVHSTSQVTVDLHSDSGLYPIYNFLNIFFKFGTPTFIFLSAFVLFYSYLDRDLTYPLMKRFYKNRLKFILIPYVIFSAFYFFTLAIHFNYYGNDYAEMFSNFFNRLATGKAYAHLYFVFISIQFYILFPLLLWVMQKKRALIKHAIWIGFAVQWTFFLLNHYFHIYDFSDIPKGSWAVSYFSYYMLGAFMGVYYEKFLEWMRAGWKYWVWGLWLLAGGLHVYIYYLQRVQDIYSDTKWYELYWNLHTILSALVLFHFAFWLFKVLPKWATKTMIHIGICSFGIYLLHPFILFVYRQKIMPQATGFPEYHIMIGLGFVLALGLSWLIVTIASKIKGSWILFGQFPKPQKKVPTDQRIEPK